MNEGIAATVSRKANNDDPKINNKSCMNSCGMFRGLWFRIGAYVSPF